MWDDQESGKGSVGRKGAWVPLTVSLVEYRKGDSIGLFFALSSVSIMALHMSFIALIVFRRDLLTLCFYAGFALNGPLNEGLKHFIRQPRPIRDRHQLGIYGMPSSHAQHSWYFAIFAILFVIVRLPEGNALENTILIVMNLSMAGIVSYGRIYLDYHTSLQVCVGGVIGGVIGAIWFAMTHCILAPAFPSIVSWSISQFLLLRDTSHIPHLLWFEYNSTVNYLELN